MRKFLLSSSIIIVYILYVLSQRLSGEELRVVPNGTPSSPTPTTPGTNPTATPTQQPVQFPSPSATPRLGQYRDGSYTGDIVDAYYGYVQVRTTIQGGKITDVQFLQYPNDRRTSIEINSQAMPYLIQEAIQAQNAQVDTISGATETSRAFRESLSAALAQAQ